MLRIKKESLKARYLMNIVVPSINKCNKTEAQRIGDLCWEIMLKARFLRCKSVAFPIIGDDSTTYLKSDLLFCMMRALTEWNRNYDTMIYIVADGDILHYSFKNASYIDDYISEVFEGDHASKYIRKTEPAEYNTSKFTAWLTADLMKHSSASSINSSSSYRGLETLIKDMSDPFSVVLMKLIDRKGMKDSEVYKKAFMERRLFSKIKNRDYHPSKNSALMLAVALELNLDETQDFIGKAGYRLTNNNLQDVIVMYCIESGIFNPLRIDEILVSHGQKSIWSRE